MAGPFTKTGRFEVFARLWVPFQARFITTNFLRADLLNMMFPTKITIPAKASLVILAMRRFHLQFCWLWPFHYWQDYLVSSKLEGILGYQGYIRIVTDWPQYLNDNQSFVRTRAKQDLLLLYKNWTYNWKIRANYAQMYLKIHNFHL